MPVGMRCCLLLLLVSYACTYSSEQDHDGAADNPPSPGFDLANSDPAAVELADSIMVAMGGKKNWDETRYLSWGLAGEREFVWDRRSGYVRIESLPDSTTYLFRVGEDGGRVSTRGTEVMDPDSVEAMLHAARTVWKHDSFWLVMPFRLKDDGLTLKYLGEERTDTARYNLLQITIAEGGAGPAGEYLAYVDLGDNLIKMCAKTDDVNRRADDFPMRWNNHKRHGNILLPGSGSSGLRDVRVHRQLPEKIFQEF